MRSRRQPLDSTVRRAEDAPSVGHRVVIDDVRPAVDRGRFPIKRTIHEPVEVTATILADSHDVLAGVLKYRELNGKPADWIETALKPAPNDEWVASFTPETLGTWEYTVEAWVDGFSTWLRNLTVKADAGQDVSSELREGAVMIHDAVHWSTSRQSHDETTEGNLRLLEFADVLDGTGSQIERAAVARDPELHALMQRHMERVGADRYQQPLTVTVDPLLARFSAWYEMFPRSCSADAARSGTFREAEARLVDIAAMGFDVLYLPPIHPIGTSHRKGRNNALVAAPGDPGSPWAIGNREGGHTAIHQELGTLDDFERFVHVANRLGLDVALDIAFQASPDHPWVSEHPSWFRHRPDGTIKYAENPPKKYQDIYPFDFETRDWRELWQALRDVFLFWIGHGVRTFRVDNPHTKAFRFWEWCIATIRRDHPDTVFLAEAFTRPALMRYLAKAGFSQSYTYFTWRNTAEELRTYLSELTAPEQREVLRPNFFANTPDILHEYLQHGGRPAFEARLLLAATLSASYGIYSGFELCEHQAVHAGSEEYMDSEKYQIRVRDWNAPGNLKELIARINAVRRAHPALQRNDTLRFHESDNPHLLAFTKTDRSGDRVFVVVNTDPHHMQHGWVRLPDAGNADRPFAVRDLLDDAVYQWQGEWNYVRLDPPERMGHILDLTSDF